MTRLLAPYLIGAFAAAALVAGVVVYVASAERAKRELEAAREYITGTEDARDATTDLPDTDHGNTEWLRDFAD